MLAWVLTTLVQRVVLTMLTGRPCWALTNVACGRRDTHAIVTTWVTLTEGVAELAHISRVAL